MKYLLSTSVLVLFLAFNTIAQSTTTPAAPPDPNGPNMKFESTTIDYGTIPHNADGIRQFKFTNTGKKDLIITSCTGSCGCTVPTCPKEVVKAGKSGQIQVKYATDRIGQFTKTVTVRSNAIVDPITLTIKGNVLPDPATPKTDGGAGSGK